MSEVLSRISGIKFETKFPHNNKIYDWEIDNYLDALEAAIEELEEIMDDVEGHEWDVAREAKSEIEWSRDDMEDVKDVELLISEDYFSTFVKEEAEIQGINLDVWPANHIDWDAAIEEFKQDYGTVEIDGHTYYYEL